MATSILGLDIGGANLKAATPDKRAVSVPFPLWKQPEKLSGALAELVGKFPDTDELAVTMTGELCDCFETKRDGVHAIIKAVRGASGGRPIRVWSTDGAFLNSEEAKENHLKVAAANWHALATFAGGYVPEGRAILVDVGSTTTDVIPIVDGEPVPEGKTDYDRLETGELVYTGIRRTPVCAILPTSPIRGEQNCTAELFATTLDAYLILGSIPEDATNCDTADGRPATKAFAHARLARMLGGDTETIPAERTTDLAKNISALQGMQIYRGLERVRERLGGMESTKPEPIDAPTRVLMHMNSDLKVFIRSRYIKFVLSGSGAFLARQVIANGGRSLTDELLLSLTDQLGPSVSACAPAYAVAVLATERRT